MVYSFELIHHSNIRYREAAGRLGRCELLCLLKALHVPVEDVVLRPFGRAWFLVFECRELNKDELKELSRHSSVGLMAEQKDGWLRPLDVPPADCLPEDLPEILKYKGKTAVPFTKFMINTAVSLTPFSRSSDILTLLDPLCGKGTSLFCSLQAGMNAVGLDQDKRAVHEADAYFSRYLKTLRYKHTRTNVSETWKNHPLPVTDYVFSAMKDQSRAKDSLRLRLACGDTGFSPALTRRAPAHVIVTDLPYGIQHAPRETDRKPESFQSLLRRVLPVWIQCLKPGGAVALSFNELTLPVGEVLSCLQDAGFHPVRDSLFSDLRHEVEQAVSRNVVFATKKKEDNIP